jgi:hypothetical protein
MAQPADSGSLALARKPRSERRPWAVPVDYKDPTDARALRKTVKGQRTLANTSAPARPVSAAEVAQARVFERLLQAECAELHELAHRLAGPADQQLDSDSSLSSQDLLQIHGRIDEVHHLLQALQGRFPHPYPNADRQSV